MARGIGFSNFVPKVFRVTCYVSCFWFSNTVSSPRKPTRDDDFVVSCQWLVGLGFSFVIPRNAMTRDLFFIWDRIRFLAPLMLRIGMTSETGTVTCHEVLTTAFTVYKVPR